VITRSGDLLTTVRKESNMTAEKTVQNKSVLYYITLTLMITGFTAVVLS
jgi:hypothetical protein